MPAHIIGGLITALSSAIEAEVWDGEVPRYDTDQRPINPSSTVTQPTNWPVVKLFMREPGFHRDVATESPFADVGDVVVQVWGTTRTSVEDLLDVIEAYFNVNTNWFTIDLGGDPQNPYQIFKMNVSRWYSGQEEGVRTQMGLLLYRGELSYEVWIHGALPR